MDNTESRMRWLWYVVAASLVIVLWSASLYLVHLTMRGGSQMGSAGLSTASNVSTLATLLFGAASVALIIFSLGLAIAAIFGWQALQRVIRDNVEKVTNRKLRLLENELRGRALGIQGYLLAEQSMNSDLIVTEKGRMEEAVRLCEQAYGFLKEVGGPAQFMGMNNLIFYSCILDDQTRRGFLLRHARILRDAAEERRSPDLLLTACRAILQYGEDDIEGKKEKERARGTLRMLAASAWTSEKEKKEAETHLKERWNLEKGNEQPKH